MGKQGAEMWLALKKDIPLAKYLRLLGHFGVLVQKSESEKVKFLQIF